MPRSYKLRGGKGARPPIQPRLFNTTDVRDTKYNGEVRHPNASSFQKHFPIISI